MNIKEALMKEDNQCRLSCGDKWMFYQNQNGLWVVMQHKYCAKKSTILIETKDEESAVKMLITE